MSAHLIFASSRIRRTPFHDKVVQAGVKAFSVYNHMLFPQIFVSLEEDYAHLKRAVQLWDVACQRQVEIVGPDALRLLQMTTPRDLSRMAEDQCFYIPMVDAKGGMLNDPVAIRLDQERYWLSIADSDMLYYCKGLASGFALDVEVFEPDVSPLAVQGPRAGQLIERLFGAGTAALRFFRHRTITFAGKEMLIARSGYSHQGGFEIYVDGAEHGAPLWDALMEAGRDLEVRAGSPNTIERIEAGLLSYGNDMTIADSPFEVGLGRYCDLDTAQACLAHAALVARRNPDRQVRPVVIEGPAVPHLTHRWPLESGNGDAVGYVSSAAWSPDHQVNVAIGMVDRSHWDAGVELIVSTPAGQRHARVRERFWS